MIEFGHDHEGFVGFTHALIDLYVAAGGATRAAAGIRSFITDGEPGEAFELILRDLAHNRMRVPREYLDYIQAEVEDPENCGFCSGIFGWLLEVQAELDAA